MLRRFEYRYKEIGPYGVLCVFCYGGIPLDTALKSLKLFAEEVAPVLRSWGTAAARGAA